MKTNWNPSLLRRLQPLSLLALAALAHGQYAVTYSGGTASTTGPNGTDTRNGWGAACGGQSFSGTANAHDLVVATFTWQGNDADIPDHVYVLEQASATWTGDAGNCDDGLGGKKTPITPGPGEASVGTRITYISFPTHTFQVTASPSANTSYSLTGIAAQNGYRAGACGFDYSAAVTPYALAIHGDCDESFHKGANGPESNTTNVLTPAFGDTAVDPGASGAQDPYTGIYRYWFGFTGEEIGFGSGFSPNWNLWGTTSSAWNHETHWVDFAPLDLAALSDNPIQRVVTLSATDASGLSANATYTLRIHHPFEKWHQIGNLPDVAEDIGDLHPDSPGYASAHGSIHCTYNNPGPEWKLLSVAVTVGTADVGGSLWKYFFKAVGIGISDLGPKPDNGDASFDGCWGSAKSTISGGTSSDDMTLYQMAPRLVLTYHAHKLEADGYGPHGYVGPVREGVTDKQEFAREWAGDFTKILTSGGDRGN